MKVEMLSVVTADLHLTTGFNKLTQCIRGVRSAAHLHIWMDMKPFKCVRCGCMSAHLAIEMWKEQSL